MVGCVGEFMEWEKSVKEVKTGFRSMPAAKCLGVTGVGEGLRGYGERSIGGLNAWNRMTSGGRLIYK